jgi:hypothetical protein
MGFMMFRNPACRGVVIECFPCGYPTNWARAICHLTNDLWLGGLGDLDAKVIEQRLGSAHARAFESMNYRLDPRAAQSLLSMADMVGTDGSREWQIDELLQHVPGVHLEFQTRENGTLERLLVTDRPESAEDLHRSRGETPSGGADSARVRSES